MSLKNGTIFDNRYKIESRLGSGGVGTVYKALELDLNRTVAIKILSNWSAAGNLAESMLRFQREAQALCQMQHSNILRVYRFGRDEAGLPFLITEYVEGEPLRDLIERAGALEYSLAIKIATRLAEALLYSHNNGIIHRDLKPENVIVDIADANNPMVKLIDFGLCKPIPTVTPGAVTLTGTGELVGSPPYMSPEQVMGQKADKTTDIYSFSLLLFEILSGRPAFQANNAAELLLMRMSMQVTPLLTLNPKSGLPGQLDELIAGCSRINAEDRIQDFEEVLQELATLAPIMPSGKFSIEPRVSAPKWKARIALSALALAAGLICLLVFNKHDSISIQQALQAPQDVIADTSQSVTSLLKQNNYDSAEKIAVQSTLTTTFKSWPPMQQADMYYQLFNLFRETPNLKVAENYAILFLKASMPFRDKIQADDPDWNTQIAKIEDFLMKSPKISRSTWHSLIPILKNVTFKTSKGDRAYILLLELKVESSIRGWQEPPLEALELYTKEISAVAVAASEHGMENIYEREINRALQTARAHRFKNMEALALGHEGRHELEAGHLEQSVKIMKDCDQILKEIDKSIDLEQLKPSSRRNILETERRIQLKLAENCASKGEEQAAKAHRKRAQKLASQSKELQDEENQDYSVQDATFKGLKPAFP